MSNFVDGSGPIFSMYLDMATEEDKELAESWKADADGILIFVRFSPHSYPMRYPNSCVIDRLILCRSRVPDLSFRQGHSTKPAGHIQLLPSKYLSSYRRSESFE